MNSTSPAFLEVKIVFEDVGTATSVAVASLDTAMNGADMSKAARTAGRETAFFFPKESCNEDPPPFALRWFSPDGEIQLCGTGSLAAAYVAASQSGSSSNAGVTFSTPAGEVVGQVESTGRTRVRFPRFALARYAPGPALLRGLGIETDVTAAARVARTLGTVLLALPSYDVLTSLRPDFGALQSLSKDELGAVVATAPGPASYDFAYRYFTPWHGKNESPVAGSALSVLGPYWAGRRGRRDLASYQASPEGAFFPVQVAREGTWIGARVVAET